MYASSFVQTPENGSIQSFNPHEGDADKINPYHGVLTLSQQQKTSNAQNNGTNMIRGPGRPPVHDLNNDELAESEDPVSEYSTLNLSIST